MEAETYPLRLARFEFMGWFDGTIVSGLEGAAKPDAVIFHRLLDRFSLRPATTLMIDDSARNLEAARRVGMRTVQFESPAALLRSLIELELLDPL
jgi:2-haloacid dehalogenase